MITRTFIYNGRKVTGYYRPEVLAEFERVKFSVPKSVVTSSTMSRAFLADKIVDSETGEVLKDMSV